MLVSVFVCVCVCLSVCPLQSVCQSAYLFVLSTYLFVLLLGCVDIVAISFLIETHWVAL